MNKGDLINKVSEVLSSKKDAQAAVDCMIETITEALAANDSVTLVGFGTFKTPKEKKEKAETPKQEKKSIFRPETYPNSYPEKHLKTL